MIIFLRRNNNYKNMGIVLCSDVKYDVIIKCCKMMLKSI